MDVQEPSMQLLAEAAQIQEPLPSVLNDESDRSSSLSDIDDNNESEAEADVESTNELSPPQASGDEEENDTEAETERLEESPDKLRKQKKVLLSADNEVTNTNTTPLKQVLPVARQDNDQEEYKNKLHSDAPNMTSPISSPVSSANEASSPGSPLSTSSKKRKRGQHTSSGTKRAARRSLNDSIATETIAAKVNSTDTDEKAAATRQKGNTHDLMEDKALNSPTDNVIEELEDVPEIEVEGEQSNDDMDMDEIVPEADNNTYSKSEGDLMIRKEAVEKIINIEEQFAIFRDRMYGEAVANINAELASLESDEPSHPEYLAISAAITRQKETRVALARTKFALQVKNWQNRGRAEQTQSYSQYAQSCRDIRDAALTRASDEWYHIQKSRRAFEDPIAVVSLASYKRTDLVAQQTAYSTEVSILSGIAKYVGFPAAPELPVATASEVEEDLKSLGTTVPLQQSQVSSSISQYLRQNLAAEKQFSKITPWANAQHHVHGLHAGYSWSPARPNSPFTPASQNLQGDLQTAIGSASTIVGSHAQTPLSSEITGSNTKSKVHQAMPNETPSRIVQNDKMQPSTQNNVYTGPRPRMQGDTSLMDGPPDGRILHEFSSPAGLSQEPKMGMA